MYCKHHCVAITEHFRQKSVFFLFYIYLRYIQAFQNWVIFSLEHRVGMSIQTEDHFEQLFGRVCNNFGKISNNLI